jgi:hypothetical protein
MSLKSVMKDIESHDFSSRVNVASDFRSYLLAIRQQKGTTALIKELESPENLMRVLLRVLELSRERVDLRYENPWDAALATYVWALSKKNSNYAILAAEAVSEVHQIWWAEKLSRHILLGNQFRSSADSTQNEFVAAPYTSYRTVQKANSGDVYFISRTVYAFDNIPAIELKYSTKTSAPAESPITFLGIFQPTLPYIDIIPNIVLSPNSASDSEAEMSITL